MLKPLRITLGAIGVFIGIVFAILPGSILFLVGGLVLLSYDVPMAKRFLKHAMASMRKGAVALDRLLLKRKLKRY